MLLLPKNKTSKNIYAEDKIYIRVYIFTRIYRDINTSKVVSDRQQRQSVGKSELVERVPYPTLDVQVNTLHENAHWMHGIPEQTNKHTYA